MNECLSFPDLEGDHLIKSCDNVRRCISYIDTGALALGAISDILRKIMDNLSNLVDDIVQNEVHILIRKSLEKYPVELYKYFEEYFKFRDSSLYATVNTIGIIDLYHKREKENILSDEVLSYPKNLCVMLKELIQQENQNEITLYGVRYSIDDLHELLTLLCSLQISGDDNIMFFAPLVINSKFFYSKKSFLSFFSNRGNVRYVNLLPESFICNRGILIELQDHVFSEIIRTVDLAVFKKMYNIYFKILDDDKFVSSVSAYIVRSHAEGIEIPDIKALVPGFKPSTFTPEVINALSNYYFKLQESCYRNMDLSNINFFGLRVQKPHEVYSSASLTKLIEETDPKILFKCLNSDFKNELLKSPQTWANFIEAVDSDDFTSGVTDCFKSNSSNLLTSVMELLRMPHSKLPKICKFIHRITHIPQNHHEIFGSDEICDYIINFNTTGPPPVEFWTIISVPEKFLEMYHTPAYRLKMPSFAIHGAAAIGALEHIPISIPNLINRQSAESLREVTAFLQKDHPDLLSHFDSSGLSRSAVTLIAAAHIFGINVALCSPQPMFTGTKDEGALQFIALACQIFYAKEKKPPLGVFNSLSVFNNDFNPLLAIKELKPPLSDVDTIAARIVLKFFAMTFSNKWPDSLKKGDFKFRNDMVPLFAAALESDDLWEEMFEVISILLNTAIFGSQFYDAVRQFLDQNYKLIISQLLKNISRTVHSDKKLYITGFSSEIAEEVISILVKDPNINTPLVFESVHFGSFGYPTFPIETVTNLIDMSLKTKVEHNIICSLKMALNMNYSIAPYFNDSLSHYCRSTLITHLNTISFSELNPKFIVELLKVDTQNWKDVSSLSFISLFKNVDIFSAVISLESLEMKYHIESTKVADVIGSIMLNKPEVVNSVLMLYYVNDKKKFYKRPFPIPFPRAQEYEIKLLEEAIRALETCTSPPLLFSLRCLAILYPQIFIETSIPIKDIGMTFLRTAGGLAKIIEGDRSESLATQVALAVSALGGLTLMAKFDDEFFNHVIPIVSTLSPGEMLIVIILIISIWTDVNLQTPIMTLLYKFDWPKIAVKIFEREMTPSVKQSILSHTFELTNLFFGYFSTNIKLKLHIVLKLIDIPGVFQKCLSGQLTTASNRRTFPLDLLEEDIDDNTVKRIFFSVSKKMKYNNRLLASIDDFEFALDLCIDSKFVDIEKHKMELIIPHGINREAFLGLDDNYKAGVYLKLLSDIPEMLTPSMYSYLITQPSIAYSLISNRMWPKLPPEIFCFLYEVIENMKLCREPPCDTIDPFVRCFYYQPQLIEFLFNAIVNDCQLPKSSHFITMFYLLATNKENMDYFLRVISENIVKASVKQVHMYVRILIHLANSKNDILTENIVNAVIDAVSAPMCRDSFQLVKYALELFRKINVYTPKLSIFLSMILNTDNLSLVSCSLFILKKFPEIQDDIKQFLLIIFDNALSQFYKDPNNGNNTEKLKMYIQNIEILNEFRRGQLMKLLSEIINDISTENELFATLLTSLAPKKPDNFQFSAQLKKDGDILTVPQSIYDLAPDFWEVVKPYLNEIYKLVEKRPYLLKSCFSFLNNFPHILPFLSRISLFRQKLRSDNVQYVHLAVRRSHILEDSFVQFNSTNVNKLSHIRVSFVGESGIDIGGVRRDWFTSITKELFNPNYGLFIPSENNDTYSLNSSSVLYNADHEQYYRFAGKIFACAVFGEVPVEAHFDISIIKALLDLPVTLKDLEDSDERFYKSLKWMLENDVSELSLTFTNEYEDHGKHKIVPLKEDGNNIPVTNENKEEFVNLIAQYRLRGQIKEQLRALTEGFHSLLPVEILKLFSPSELDLLLCGLPTIDISDLYNQCVVISPYKKEEPPVLYFFQAISKWSADKLGKLLLFITGASKVPIGGFEAFKKSNKPITIQPGGGPNRLPCAHTCSNTLDLPNYGTVEELSGKLMLAISECDTFGFN